MTAPLRGAEREWPDPAEVVGDSAITFTLTYQGNLPACTQNNTRSKEKHEVRAQLHPQMVQLWEHDPILRKAKDDVGRTFIGNAMKSGKVRQLGDMAQRQHQWIHVDGTKDWLWFVPLITRHNGLGCHLDIKFMRPGPRNGLIVGGDLDNRIKTLFDGLRMPRESGELPDNGWLPDRSDQFFYCLLEDDSLITRVCISTEPLLVPNVHSDSEVRLDIGVKIVVLAPSDHNQFYRE